MKTPNQPCYEGGALLSKGITQERNIDYWQHQDNPTFLKVIPISNREATQYQAKVEQLKNSVAPSSKVILKLSQTVMELKRCESYLLILKNIMRQRAVIL
jgi:hypothetical protein